MARLEYFIVCESSSVDSETNQLSLFHILDDVFPAIYPEYLPNIDAVCLWILEPDDEEIELRAILHVKPPGVPVGPKFPMSFSKGSRRYRAIISISNIPLNQSGELTFEVLLNDIHAASHTVTVHDLGSEREEINFE